MTIMIKLMMTEFYLAFELGHRGLSRAANVVRYNRQVLLTCI